MLQQCCVAMLKLQFLIYFSTTILTVVYCNNLPHSIQDVIINHFQEGERINLYVCQRRDALKLIRKSLHESINIKVNHLNKIVETDLDNLISDKPQKLGIFLDTDCEEGIDFLKKNLHAFNGTFRWLIWTKRVDDTKDILNSSRLQTDSDVSIVYKDGDSLMLIDIFRMHPTRPFVITNTEQWADDKRLIRLDQPPPRIDFQGAQLTGSLLLIHMVVNSTDQIPLLFDPLKFPGKDGNRRYCFTLFTHLAQFYNFTYKYIYSDVWGYPQPDGNWSGMVGQIFRGEADVGLSAVHYSIQRTKIVDFVGCLDFTRVCFTFLQPKLFGSYKALILPLDKSVWACLLAVILIAIFLLRVTSFYDKSACHNDSWGGSFLLVMAAIAQQGIPDSSNRLATKLLYLSLLVVSFMAVVHYNTSILNGLLLPAPNAIQNIEQLIDSDLKVATSNSKYVVYDMTLNDSLTVKLRNKMLKAKFPNNGIFTIKDGLDMLKKGGFALYVMAKEAYPQMHSLFSAAEVCSLSEINKYKPLPTGGIVRNNSPYKEIFNRKFTMLRERGLMDRGKLLWNPRKPECNWKQDALVIGIEPLFLAYLVLIFGVLISLIFLAIELYEYKGRKLNKIITNRDHTKFFIK